MSPDCGATLATARTARPRIRSSRWPASEWLPWMASIPEPALALTCPGATTPTRAATRRRPSPSLPGSPAGATRSSSPGYGPNCPAADPGGRARGRHRVVAGHGRPAAREAGRPGGRRGHGRHVPRHLQPQPACRRATPAPEHVPAPVGPPGPAARVAVARAGNALAETVNGLYEACRRVLRDELGVEPAQETALLVEARSSSSSM